MSRGQATRPLHDCLLAREGRWFAAQLGLDPHSWTAMGHRWCCHGLLWAGSSSPRPGAYSGQVEVPQGAQTASLPWELLVLTAQVAALQAV